MISWQFYGDSSILGLKKDNGEEIFIDLADLSGLKTDDDGLAHLPVYIEPEAVGGLFGSYGCMEDCPLADESDLY